MDLENHVKFKIYAPPECKSHELNDDGTLTITGILSTTNEDLDGEIVTQQGLQSLASQAVGLNLHLDHNHKYDGGIGVITDADLGENFLRITATVLPEYAVGIKQRLDLGMKFGFSIGGIPVIKGGNSRIINEFLLLEISLTLLPANWDTFGTVETKGIVESKCITGACHYILKKNKSSEIMETKKANNQLEVTEEVKQELTDIVNEAIYNIKPAILDEIRGEVGVIVQDVVSQTLTDLLPTLEKDVDDEILEESEDDIIEQDVEDAIEDEKDATEDVVDDVKAEAEDIESTKAEEPEEDEDVPAEEPEATDDDIVEDEKEVTDDPIDGVEEDGADYVETSETAQAPKVIVDVKSIQESILKDLKENLNIKELTDGIVKEVEANIYKNLDAKRKKATTKSTSTSKLDQYKKTADPKKKTNKTKFLDSDKRDRFGRNKKYLK